MLAALVGRSLQRSRGLLIGVAVLLGGFQVMMTVIARELARTNNFLQLAALMPAAVQGMTGTLVFTTFGGFASFGFFHPLVVLVISEAAIFLASEPSWEMEAGIVDLTLARAVPRRMVIVRTLCVACGAIAALAILMLASMRLGLGLFAPAGAAVPPIRTTALFAANLAALGWWFAAAALLVATLVRRRSAALGVSGIGAIALYLLHLVSEMWSRAAPLRGLSPYHYYNAPALLRGVADWPRDIAVLLVTAAIMVIAALRVYDERDL